MKNFNTNNIFVFAVLVHNTGSISFFPRSTTFGEIADCYKDQQVTYMPHFKMEDDDVLCYNDVSFTSFEALFNTCGEEALHNTFIYKDQPKYDNEDEMDADKEVVSSYFIHDLDKDMVFEYVLLEGMALSYKGSVYFSYNSLVDDHGEQALNKAVCISAPSSPSLSNEVDADYDLIPF